MLPLPILAALLIIANAPKPAPVRKAKRAVGLDYFLSLPAERVEGCLVYGD